MDPFDMFDIIFGGRAAQFQRDRFRRRRHQYYDQQNENPQANQRNNGNLMIIQLLPFLILILFSVIPYVFQTVINKFNPIETRFPIYSG